MQIFKMQIKKIIETQQIGCINFYHISHFAN